MTKTASQIKAANQRVAGVKITATDAFIEGIGAVDAKLQLIREWVANHGNVDPDAVNWGNVGDVANVNEALNEILAFLSIKAV